MSADFLRPLTPSIQVTAEGCPVDVIKYDMVEVPGPAPWANQPEPVAAAAGAEVVARAPVAKVAAPMGPPDFQCRSKKVVAGSQTVRWLSGS